MNEADPRQDFFADLSKEALFRVFLNQVDFSVYFKDRDLRYILCSASFVRLLGYQTPDAVIGKCLEDFIDPEQADTIIEMEKEIMDTRKPILNIERHIEMSGPRSTVSDIWVSLSEYPLIDNSGNVCGVWGISRDISEAKNTEQKLVQKNKQCDELNSRIHQLSTTDEVTGLYNRRYFEEMVKRNMRLFSRVRGRGYSAGFAIILMDIDHCTDFCSDHGAQYKDILLQYVSDILRSCSRSSDDIFRVGNDEFALLLSDTGRDGAEVLSARITEMLKNKPFMIDEQEFVLTMSFGYSVYEDQLDASEMIIQADQELFDAKKKRKPTKKKR